MAVVETVIPEDIGMVAFMDLVSGLIENLYDQLEAHRSAGAHFDPRRLVFDGFGGSVGGPGKSSMRLLNPREEAGEIPAGKISEAVE